MNSPRIEWSSFLAVGNESEYLLDAIRSGWVSGGPYVTRLEKRVEDLYPGSKAYAVSNGTLALQLAVQLLQVRAGDRVLVPNFCFQAAANILHQFGAIPVFCDVNPITWNISVDTVRRAYVDGVVGVIIVHNYGFAAPSEEISRWARDMGLWVIEDCAEAWFTKLADRYVGQFGDIATFSMHATKTISVGEGGLVLLNDARFVDKLLLLRSHGLNRESVHYQHRLPGNNYRLSNLLAAVGVAQLEAHALITSRQLWRANYYLEALANEFGLELQGSVAGAVNVPWAVAVRMHPRVFGVNRDAVMGELRQRGIESRPGFYPATTLSYNQRYITSPLSVSESLASEVVVLPCAPTLDQASLDYVINNFLDILRRPKRRSTNITFCDLLVESNAKDVINSFRLRLGSSGKTFRYFDKREWHVVKQHLVSLAILADEVPVAYGHIELEEGVAWLGVAVVEGAQGRGYGRCIVARLIRDAARCGVKKLHLKVDKVNLSARRLYESFGFLEQQQQSTSDALHMTLLVTNDSYT
jgi:perosamine synthetase